jgi:hypothetical protein
VTVECEELGSLKTAFEVVTLLFKKILSFFQISMPKWIVVVGSKEDTGDGRAAGRA